MPFLKTLEARTNPSTLAEPSQEHHKSQSRTLVTTLTRPTLDQNPNIMCDIICGYFKLQNMSTSDWIVNTSDATIVPYKGGDYDDQYWRMVSCGGGYFKLQNKHSGKWLTHLQNGDSIIAYHGADYEDQYWKVIPHADGKHFKLENKLSHKWVTESGGKIIPFTGATYDDQYWKSTQHKEL
ncbi:hypothetical protein BGW38_005640 [Lunasporangiospora selenospora]|uniref:Ricin B lectin domain-containing protein n=1 Tax=Lunasporangiospora selenospora TaxID=979761 RepID=A0A9P6KAQ9_9FUNG|nr:hypothetical protein BGW38_005640 [Lunasporangiospora selenospora]